MFVLMVVSVNSMCLSYYILCSLHLEKMYYTMLKEKKKCVVLAVDPDIFPVSFILFYIPDCW